MYIYFCIRFHIKHFNKAGNTSFPLLFGICWKKEVKGKIKTQVWEISRVTDTRMERKLPPKILVEVGQITKAGNQRDIEITTTK